MSWPDVFRITPNESDEKVILRYLLKLSYQEDEVENIKEVRIRGCEEDDYEQAPFRENIVSDIIRAFRRISSKGIVWDRLSVQNYDQDDPHFQSLLSQICKLELFREIILSQMYEHGGHLVIGEMTEETAKDISDAMKNNPKLERLSIERARISPIVSSFLCEGLKAENQNLTELSFVQVDFGDASLDQSSAADAVSHLVTGFQNNKTLKTLSFSQGNLSDHDSSRIIKALEGHPTLEHFKYQCVHIMAREETMESLWDLLRNPWKIQNLTHLDLFGNDISKVPVLAASVLVNIRQSRLRSLNLDDNPIIGADKQEDQSALLQLLMSAPQLGYVANPSHTETSSLFTPLIRHYLDWNRFGRVLTNGNEKFLPLSMWPLVFARANTILQRERHPFSGDLPDRRPNVIYQLFHGFLSLHSQVLSMGIESRVDNNDAAEPAEKRQRVL